MMAQRSEAAQERVRETLQRNPDATTQELQEAAQSVEPSIAGLSRRQFNAGYVLPLKRAASAGKRKKTQRGGRKKQGTGRRREAAGETVAATAAEAPAQGRNAKAAGESARDAIRATLLQFARDFSAAESRTDIVGVLADVDRYVDRIVDARG